MKKNRESCNVLGEDIRGKEGAKSLNSITSNQNAKPQYSWSNVKGRSAAINQLGWLLQGMVLI